MRSGHKQNDALGQAVADQGGREGLSKKEPCIEPVRFLRVTSVCPGMSLTAVNGKEVLAILE